MPNSLLSGLTPAQFLRRHWQKKPLLARNALPRAAELVNRNELFELAQCPEIESRLVIRNGKRWHVTHGPFRQRDFSRLPKSNWTLLVQGVNHVLPQAQQLLSPFAFISYARLDDLMISYAPPGGGVGPHFDSYDVFLVQGEGRRRWSISSQRELSLVDGVPLKILRNFRAAREWTLGPGDMLYLPPRYAHDGIAVDPCITCSVGFRAPSAQDLCSRFFDFLNDRLDTQEFHSDPDLRPTRHPARISRQLTVSFLNLLKRARWTRSEMLQFIGEDLSTPKAHVVFATPSRALSRDAFCRVIARRGLRLDLKSILLYDDQAFYINGERITLASAARNVACRLADRRSLAPAVIPRTAIDVFYAWYRAGYLHPGLQQVVT